MMEVLQFVFRSFWTWLGTVILLAVIVSPFYGLLRIIVVKPKANPTEGGK